MTDFRKKGRKPYAPTNLYIFTIAYKKIFKTTEDGSMNAVPRVLYGPYLILGVFGSYMF